MKRRVQIREQLDRAVRAQEEWLARGVLDESYAAGVEAALRWVIEEGASKPMEP